MAHHNSVEVTAIVKLHIDQPRAGAVALVFVWGGPIPQGLHSEIL